jgi:hypothetical protein
VANFIKLNTVGDDMRRRNVVLHHNFTVTSASLKQSTGKNKNNENVVNSWTEICENRSLRTVPQKAP